MSVSPAAFKLAVVVLTWCVENQTRGRFTAADLAVMPTGTADPDAAVGELVRSGWLVADGEGWDHTDTYRTTQLSPERLAMYEAQRVKSQQKQQRYRDRKREPEPPGGNADGGVTDGVTSNADSDEDGDGSRNFSRSGQVQVLLGQGTNEGPTERAPETCSGADDSPACCPSCGAVLSQHEVVFGSHRCPASGGAR